MSMPAIRGMVLSPAFDFGFWICDFGLRRIGRNGPIQNPKSAIQNGYPCFCLCFVLVQMTRTIPLRRTILQFSQIRRTLALTFMTFQPLNEPETGESMSID